MRAAAPSARVSGISATSASFSQRLNAGSGSPRRRSSSAASGRSSSVIALVHPLPQGLQRPELELFDGALAPTQAVGDLLSTAVLSEAHADHLLLLRRQ